MKRELPRRIFTESTKASFPLISHFYLQIKGFNWCLDLPWNKEVEGLEWLQRNLGFHFLSSNGVKGPHISWKGVEQWLFIELGNAIIPNFPVELRKLREMTQSLDSYIILVATTFYISLEFRQSSIAWEGEAVAARSIGMVRGGDYGPREMRFFFFWRAHARCPSTSFAPTLCRVPWCVRNFALCSWLLH